MNNNLSSIIERYADTDVDDLVPFAHSPEKEDVPEKDDVSEDLSAKSKSNDGAQTNNSRLVVETKHDPIVSPTVHNKRSQGESRRYQKWLNRSVSNRQKNEERTRRIGAINSIIEDVRGLIGDSSYDIQYLDPELQDEAICKLAEFQKIIRRLEGTRDQLEEDVKKYSAYQVAAADRSSAM